MNRGKGMLWKLSLWINHKKWRGFLIVEILTKCLRTVYVLEFEKSEGKYLWLLFCWPRDSRVFLLFAVQIQFYYVNHFILYVSMKCAFRLIIFRFCLTEAGLNSICFLSLECNPISFLISHQMILLESCY